MREPTVREYLDAANKDSKFLQVVRQAKATGLEGPSRRMSRREQRLEREAKYGTAQEKQKPKGKPSASEWKVQTGKGGAFVLVHKESGDFYADYVSMPATSWGAKRFVTVDEAYRYLNDPKHFKQGQRPQSAYNRMKTRGDKVQERVRKQMGLR